MPSVWRAGQGYGGWKQISDHSWVWDSDITWEQTFTKKEKVVDKKEAAKYVQPFDKIAEDVLDKLNEQEFFGKKKNTDKVTKKPKVSTGQSMADIKIKYVKHPEKGARQMILILDKLQSMTNSEALKKTGVPIGHLWEKLEHYLPTRQPVSKVYKHYHREMVDKGYISISS